MQTLKIYILEQWPQKTIWPHLQHIQDWSDRFTSATCLDHSPFLFSVFICIKNPDLRSSSSEAGDVGHVNIIFCMAYLRLAGETRYRGRNLTHVS